MIGFAKEDGDAVKIYDTEGRYKSTIPREDGMVGFTSATVSIKSYGGLAIKIYDENGRYKSTIPA